MSLSHTDVVPAEYGPVGSGRPGASTRITGQYRANSQGKMGNVLPFQAAVAFGYVMNQIGPRWQNPRTRALVNAVYESLAR